MQDLLIPFIRSADEDTKAKDSSHGFRDGEPCTALVEPHEPHKLLRLLNLELPDGGEGRPGFLEMVKKVLRYSVNTWDQGFMDKLCASTDAPGVASELVLAVLNTNLHVYQVSPALTIIEKTTSRTLANLFGLTGPYAGGISVQGGSASNTTSIVIARNTLFPDTKIHGNAAQGRKLVLFTSAHGHYSIEKAAQMLGFGHSAVWAVPTDQSGRMIPSELSNQIETAKANGFTPFYVNATAGTTVLGSYDPIPPIAAICATHKLWLHIDASWGGPAIFSPPHSHKLTGSHLADSIAINPHKMLGVPITCSFLLGADLRAFHAANTVPAPYLFHSAPASPGDIFDLADLTLQCGRRGDSLKLALGWIYHGRDGYGAQVGHAFAMAAALASRVVAHTDLVLVSESPPPCLQVCFYYAPGRRLRERAEENSAMTVAVAAGLVLRGFMVDYADGERGSFLRVVVSRVTSQEAVVSLVDAVVRVGGEVWGRVGGGREEGESRRFEK